MIDPIDIYLDFNKYFFRNSAKELINEKMLPKVKYITIPVSYSVV